MPHLQCQSCSKQAWSPSAPIVDWGEHSQIVPVALQRPWKTGERAYNPSKPFCLNTRRLVPLQRMKKVQEEIMGPNPTRSLSRAESKLDLRASSCTVCSRKGDLGVARCQQFWTRCSYYAAAGIQWDETCGLCYQSKRRDRTWLCPNRKRGSDYHTGTWTLGRIPERNEIVVLIST